MGNKQLGFNNQRLTLKMSLISSKYVTSALNNIMSKSNGLIWFMWVKT